MKRLSILGAAVVFLFVSYAMMNLSTGNAQKKPGGNGGFAVVELFTSEGCSSCPPADAAVATLLNDYTSNVYVLGFHVDYWNRLGWKDEYSSSEYSKRQQQYSNALHLRGVYTPQAIVNGRTEFTGSDTRRLHAAVEDGLKGGDTPRIELSAKTADDRSVNVSYKLDAPFNGSLNIALVQLHAQSDVRSGENTGKQLHHVNVVRGFMSTAVREAKGEVTLTVPEGLAAKNCKIIAYLQDAGSWKITGAASADIERQRGISSTAATIFNNRIYFREYLDIFAAIYSGI